MPVSSAGLEYSSWASPTRILATWTALAWSLAGRTCPWGPTVVPFFLTMRMVYRMAALFVKGIAAGHQWDL